MTWIDWTIVIVLVCATMGGISQGLIRSACSLAGLVFGLLIAAWNYGRIAAILLPVLRIEALANAIAFLLIAILVMMVANFAGGVISHAVHGMGLGCLDRLAGAFFGFMQGVLLVTLTILVVVAFFPKEHWLVESKLPKQCFGALHWSSNVTPAELTTRVRNGLKSLEEQTPEWMHPQED
jgi:membrane protein required for colicin V production